MNFNASEFFNTLQLQSARFWLERYEETSGTSRGDHLTRMVAFPKWRAEITIAPALSPEAANDIIALLEDVSDTNNTFDMWNPYAQYPKQDSDGSTISGQSPTVNSAGSNEISLSVPNGYVITKGDMFTVTYGSNPTRKALFRAMETVTSSGGNTPSFRVSPPVKTGIAGGNSVDLTRPTARMKILAYDAPSAEGAVTTGITFSAIEVGR